MTIRWTRNDDGTGLTTIDPERPPVGSDVWYSLVDETNKAEMRRWRGNPLCVADHCTVDAQPGSDYCVDHGDENGDMVDPDWAYDLMIERRMDA